MTEYQFPEFYSFPPFFTLQDNPITRQKQLDLWVDHVIKYTTTHKITELLPTSSSQSLPLFNNPSIKRALDPQDIQTVLDHVQKSGYGTWLTADKSKFGLSTINTAELAAALHKWADQYDLMSSVETLDEIINGTMSRGQPFYNSPMKIVYNALLELENQGLASLYEGDDMGSLGVKFIRP
jgi:ESCRT-II complex subunit VPS25